MSLKWIRVYLPVIVIIILATLVEKRLTSTPELFKLLNPSNVWSIIRGNNVFDDMTIRPVKTNLSTPTIKQAMYYNHLAAIAFCNDPAALSNWSCDDCVAVGPDVKLLRVFKHPGQYTQAYIAVNTAEEEILLVFRGSIIEINVLENFTIEQLHIPGGTGNTMVHKGGWNHWLLLKNQMIRELRNALRKYPRYHVNIIGMSFGSVVASLCLYDLKHTPEFTTIQYSLYTYGGQRTGNLDFAIWMHSQKIPAIRVVNNADLLPHTYPSSLGYVHHSRELWINRNKNIFCSEDVLEDPNCSNSLGPIYNFFDHLTHWDVNYPPNDCIISDTVPNLVHSLRSVNLRLFRFNRSTYGDVS